MLPTTNSLDTPFDPEPHTQNQYLRELWKDMKEVRAQTKTTNGRVTRLERIVLAFGGIFVGYFGKEGVAEIVKAIIGGL